MVSRDASLSHKTGWCQALSFRPQPPCLVGCHRGTDTDVHGAEGRTAPRLFLAMESGDLAIEGKLHFSSLYAHPGATGGLGSDHLYFLPPRNKIPT